jgi:2-isopropylmalate synthase
LSAATDRGATRAEVDSEPPALPALHLARWTVTSGSNAQSRGAVVIEAGNRHWQATATGNGAVDALYRAVDDALARILAGHPRLVAYDVHAVQPGPDAEGVVTVAILPPEGVSGPRAAGRYTGNARSTNIIAASIDAYIDAINAMLAEEHWAGAPGEAGHGPRAGRDEAHDHRTELDADEAAVQDPTAWFNR